jgi:hypothetical protein
MRPTACRDNRQFSRVIVLVDEGKLAELPPDRRLAV